MKTVTRKQGFTFNKVAAFNTNEEAVKYCEGILKRMIRKNAKADKDVRNNAFGVESLPWFEINGIIYKSKLDPRV